MNFNSLKYLFKEGVKNLLNNIFMSLASIGVLTACLLLVGFSIILKNNVGNIIKKMGQESVINIYFKNETKPEQIEEMKNTLSTNENIEFVEHITKEKALETFKELYNNEIALEYLTKNNVLPISFNVHMKNIEKMEEILKITEEEKYKNIIDEVKAPTKFTKIIKDIDKTSKITSIILIIAFIIASIVIISNTIRAAVFSRRREIAIMKQVGATDSFVRFPFLIEGACIGAISAVIAFILSTIIYETIYAMLVKSSSEFLRSYFTTMIPFNEIALLLGIGYASFGILSGSIGSIISLRKYLKI